MLTKYKKDEIWKKNVPAFVFIYSPPIGGLISHKKTKARSLEPMKRAEIAKKEEKKESQFARRILDETHGVEW